MLESIEKFLNNIMEPIKGLLSKDSHSVFFVILFFIGVLIFFFTYETLHKDK